MRISRRGFLGGLTAAASSTAAPVFAGAPFVSPVPQLRPQRTRSVAAVEDILAEARLSGETAFALCDVETGQFLEVRRPLLALPPASVTKCFTALYALDTLTQEHRFVTRLVALGPVRDGRLEGDLALIGGGDPTLDSDALGDMARALSEAGIVAVTGRFLVDAGALPQIAAIEPGQPAQAGYNPAVGGLNLNFNRVYFQWRREDQGYAVTLDARGERFRPEVQMARMRVVDRSTPIYTYDDQGGAEEWTVARPALGKAGGRWLPVRRPARYAAEVFRTLAGEHGVRLPEPVMAPCPAGGTELVRHASAPLSEVMRAMLRYSTNITAEAAGLAATRARGIAPRNLADSAQEMARWAGQKLELPRLHFADHSGLGDGTRVSASQMVRMLRHPVARAQLAPLLKELRLRDAAGRPVADHPVRVEAKTGTLNFVSALAGYVTTPGGRRLGFAILSADLPRRAALLPSQRERPVGGRGWAQRARRMQGRLLERWGLLHDA